MTNLQHQTIQPLLRPAPPAGEEIRVAQIFDAVEKHIGFVPDGLRLYGISPPLLESFVGNVSYFLEGTSLSPVLTAMIRYLVSSQANCQFCIDLNESLLDSLGVNLQDVRSAREDLSKAPVDERERPLLHLAIQAVNEPQRITEENLESARSKGWSDREMFDAVVQAANIRAFNFVLSTFKVEHQGVFA